VKTDEKAFIGFDTLKRAVSMIQILDRYGLTERLHRSGDSLSGPCPIHAGHNKTQFRVSLSKNCWICFGDCNGGGSIVDFVSRKEGLGIRDAALLIQDWFNVQPPNGNGSQLRDAYLAAGTREPTLASANLLPQPEFNPPLRFTLQHVDKAHPYLAARGLSQETIETFGLGYCASGVMAGRIVIPIHNREGRLVAYAGRWPGEPPDGQPKYRLPKGFRKSLELFNQHRAKQADPARPLVVVEGFFGCMRVWQAGHRRVVSTMGSMVSRTQEELIVQAAGSDGRVILMFDEDAAGRKGRADARERLSRQVQVEVVRFEAEGTQPDDLLPENLLALVD
jgi:DNA primase